MRFVVMGAPGDTANLGVNALLYSMLAGIWGQVPTAQVTVADHGRGVRRVEASFGGRQRAWTGLGMVNTRRYNRPESLALQSVAARFAPRALPATRAIVEADAVLDISGGDSFTDIYGPQRFETVVVQKQLALRLGTPLVLLPQTYGPFRTDETRAVASDIVRRSHSCWSRDERSHEVLVSLLGDDADPTRHRRGVDVAFALPVEEPPADESPATRQWLADRDRGRPLAGINVSGLVWRRPQDFDITFDYVEAVATAVRALVDDGADVLLVPHQINRSPTSTGPSDTRATEDVLARVGDLGGHVAAVDLHSEDPRHAKWWIGHCDWFTGPRMHATIGALSQGIATLATAYSMKAAGVFATAGVEDAVVDLHALDAQSYVDTLLDAFRERERTAARIAPTIEELRARASSQLAEVLDLTGARRDT